jgi:hypothetical protein
MNQIDRTDRNRTGEKSGEGARAYLSGEVLEDGGEVDGCAGADTLSVLAGLEEPGDPADGKLQPGLRAPRRRLLRRAGTDRLTASRHRDESSEAACAWRRCGGRRGARREGD